jgi:TRAP-type mannitol/chloroaromatic compound transport system permease large subunit
MLLTVGVLIVVTGLPAWLLLILVSTVFGAAGVAAGLIPLELAGSLPARLLGLLEADLLQALVLFALMGALLNRMPLAQATARVGERMFDRSPAAPALGGLLLGTLFAPMNGSAGATVAMLAGSVGPRLQERGIDPARRSALLAAAETLGVVVPPSLVLILLSDAMLRAHTEAVNITQQSARIINLQDIFRGALVPRRDCCCCWASAWRRGGPTGMRAATPPRVLRSPRPTGSKRRSRR